MKLNHRGWLLIVLVAFTQLAILLASEMWLSDWLVSRSREIIQQADTTSVASELSLETIAQQTAVTIGTARSYSFFIILLVGLIGSNIIVAILIRYNDVFSEVNEHLVRVRDQSSRELLRTKNAVIFGLAKLAESRDNDTGEHLDRIKTYVSLLSEDLAQHIPEIDQKFIRNLELASSLHDIGKVGIPDSILLKPGRLTSLEREIMEEHAVIGGDCLEAIQMRLGDNDFMEIAKNVAYSHHERWDGTGYPHGAVGENVPLEARIVAVADVYDALTSKRPYKRAMSHEESRAIIVSGSGTQFDPEVVAAFLRNEDAFQAISLRQQFVNDDDATSEFQKRSELVAAANKLPQSTV